MKRGSFTIVATVEGVYRNGKVELSEVPKDFSAHGNTEIRVIVTFLPPPNVDLQARGIDEAQAAELRARLPDMDIYDCGGAANTSPIASST